MIGCISGIVHHIPKWGFYGISRNLSHHAMIHPLFGNFSMGTSPIFLRFGGNILGRLSKFNMYLVWRKNMFLEFELIFNVSLYHQPVDDCICNEGIFFPWNRDSRAHSYWHIPCFDHLMLIQFQNTHLVYDFEVEDSESKGRISKSETLTFY